MLRLPNKTPGWTHLLKKQGSNYLVWLAANKIMSDKFNVLATALWSLLQQRIQTEQEAGEVWNAVPAVLARCNEQATYEMPGAPLAYAWVHLLDRYARTWRALELLVAGGCLPLAKFGVRALDVGTGPGPSAFAVHDFYAALTQFARETGIEELNQPPDITCVEFDEGTNALRHDLAEVIFVQSGGASPSVLRMCGSLRDFKMLLPMEERMQMRHHLRWKADEYFDAAAQEWNSDPIYSHDQANTAAQSLHRYRFIVFSNFLTSVGSITGFERNLAEILADAQPGSVVMILGGKGGPYPTIYDYVDRLAKTAGFQQKMKEESVSSNAIGLSERVFAERARAYTHIQGLMPDVSDGNEAIRRFFELKRRSTATSQMWIYRKYKSTSKSRRTGDVLTHEGIHSQAALS